jgi:hypothetical protein
MVAGDGIVESGQEGQAGPGAAGLGDGYSVVAPGPTALLAAVAGPIGIGARRDQGWHNDGGKPETDESTANDTRALPRALAPGIRIRPDLPQLPLR